MQPLTQERVKAVSRLAASLVAAANAALSLTGRNPLPYTDTEVGAAASAVLGVAATIWVWWKDNVITRHAATGHMVTVQERRERNAGRHASGAMNESEPAGDNRVAAGADMFPPAVTMSQADAVARLDTGGEA